jgi:hypothetical protein
MNTQISEINPSIYTKKTLFESHPSCREEWAYPFVQVN